MNPNTNARYEIVSNTPGGDLIIRDLCDGTCKSITNDAENVVRQLVRSGILDGTQRLLYYDTEGKLDQIGVKNGRFDGFILLNL